MVYCRVCGMYTTRNCKGLKDACPRQLGTRSTWAMRMGREKRHPTDRAVCIAKEWDVEGIKAKWKSEEEAVGSLKAALESDVQVEVVWDDEGGLRVRVHTEQVGMATQHAGVQSSNVCSLGDQANYEQSSWVEADDYPWSLEDELGFFGAHPEWGVG